MDEHRRHLARGFNWLGGATVIARVVDALSMLAVILFLTKQQVGTAALVVSIGMIIEALDGFGTGEALIQGPPASRITLDTLFWFILGTSFAAAALTMLASPALALAFGIPSMPLYLLPIALKQPLVGAAVIPIASLNRALRYERIAVVNICASLLAAASRIGFAAAGAGVWAPIAGYAASGLFVLAGALLANPFTPRLRFRRSSIKPLLRFGVRATTSNLFEQLLRNIDFLLVGSFYGTARLAVYRVAFDLAMEPAMAVGTLVNRTALPVFARLAAAGQPVEQALAWSLGRVIVLTAPLTGGLILAADPLTAMLHDRQGHSYAAAALPLKLLAAASLLRITTQLLYPLMMGSGRPGTAARLSALTLVLLSGGIVAVGCLLPGQSGIVAVSAVWLGVYPLVLLWGAAALKRWKVSVLELAGSLLAPAAGLIVMVTVVWFALLLLGPAGNPTELGVTLSAVALTYAVLFQRARKAEATRAPPQTSSGSRAKAR